jgi:hypothetical protein
MRRLLPALLLLVTACSAIEPSDVASTAAARECLVTPYATGTPSDPNTASFTSVWYGNGSLWAGLDQAYEGKWYAGPLGVKVLWYRSTQGALTIVGARLDQAAPPLTAHIPEGYGLQGPQSTSIEFPTEGCWKVTGRVDGQTLEFTVQVNPQSENPVK